jgi:hypothetical protein
LEEMGLKFVNKSEPLGTRYQCSNPCPPAK